MVDTKKSTYVLGRYLKICKDILKLNDWDITIEWVNEEELVKFFNEEESLHVAKVIAKQAVAGTDVGSYNQKDTSFAENKSSRIMLKRGSFDTKYDAVITLCHELLHILLAPIAPPDRDRRGGVILEQIINTLQEPLAVVVFENGNKPTRRN